MSTVRWNRIWFGYEYLFINLFRYRIASQSVKFDFASYLFIYQGYYYLFICYLFNLSFM